MVRCVVRGCVHPQSPTRKRFFSFPDDPARARVWLRALRDTERVITDDHRVCEDHFLSRHITPDGISPDAVPVLPEEAEEAEDDDDEEDYEEEECEDANAGVTDGSDTNVSQEHVTTKYTGVSSQRHVEHQTDGRNVCVSPERRRKPVSSGRRRVRSLQSLTMRFLELFHSSPHGLLDLNQAARQLGTTKRRVYDITDVLMGIRVIRKAFKSKILWIHPAPAQRFGKLTRVSELQYLKSTEAALDRLIRDCAQQLFTLTDSTANAASAYVTLEDVCRIQAFTGQTVIAITAPEETKLEVPTPSEDSIQIRLSGGRGPVRVVTCEDDAFTTLEESRIPTRPLVPDVSSGEESRPERRPNLPHTLTLSS